MNFVGPEDKLVYFPERFLNFKEELDFTHEELAGVRGSRKEGLYLRWVGEKGFKVDTDRDDALDEQAFHPSYPVLSSEELFELGSLKSQYHAKKVYSP